MNFQTGVQPMKGLAWKTGDINLQGVNESNLVPLGQQMLPNQLQ